MERKDLYDAIWKRTSVRKYDERPIEKEKIEQLRKSISSLNETSGLTMEFAEEFDSFKSVLTIMFKGVRSAIVIKGKKNDPDLREKCGYYGEIIVLEATALGLGTCWVAGFNKKSRSLNAGDDEEVVCVISIGYGRDGMCAPATVPRRKTRSVSDFLNGNADVPDWIKTAMVSVQFAPTAMNSQKTRFRYSDGALYAEIPAGRFTMIDLGITKLHFELAADGKFELGSPGRFVKN